MNPPKLADLSSTPSTTPESDRLLVQKTQMGTTEAYLGAVTLEWLANRVGFASQLPLFQPHLDRETQNVERGTHTAETIIQRPLDWSRQAPLAQYLATRATHKFPPLLVVLSPEWVDDSLADEWDLMGKATRSASYFLPLEGQNPAGWLAIPSDVSVYALDGQHRLMGVQGLLELIQTGQLQPYNKSKKPTGKPIVLEDLAKNYDIEIDTLKNLSQETIGVEFIPAVVKGETREEARRRVRSIFVHVNLMAVPLSKGQLALLDEDDGFSIVARHAAISHPLLNEKAGRHPRVNWD
ncbi:MAG: DGQHR domain-containing protein, partial [Geitlerinemataceae cyanobacterium]